MLNLMSSFDGEDVFDCRPALLKSIATATPASRVVSDTFNYVFINFLSEHGQRDHQLFAKSELLCLK